MTVSRRPKGKPENAGRRGPGGCGICRFEKRHAVDLAICYGDSLRSVAERFSLPYDAVLRHAKNHLNASQRAALLTATKPSDIDVEALTESESQGLLAGLVAMRARLAQHAQACAAVGNHAAAIRAEAVVLSNYEVVGKLVGSLIARSEVRNINVTLTPGYQKMCAALVRILKPYPALAVEVANALAEIERDDAAEIVATGKPVLIEHVVAPS
jgi:hypothetical protein